MRILRKESPIFTEETHSLPDEICESISIKIENAHAHPQIVLGEQEHSMGKAHALRALNLFHRLPPQPP